MKYFASVFIILSAVIMQTAFLPHFKISNTIANLFLVILISWVILRKRQRAYFWALAGGLLLDLNSETIYGATALAFLLTIFISSLIIRKFINIDNLTSKVVLIALATVIYKIIFLILLAISHLFELYELSGFFSKNFIYFVIIEIILNITAIFIVFPFIKTCNKFILRLETKRIR